MISILETKSGKRYVVEDRRGRQFYRPIDDKTTLSVSEASAYLQCSPQFLYQVFASGKLPYSKNNRTGYRVKIDDLMAFRKQYFKWRVKAMGYKTRQELIDENQELLDRIEELEAEIEDDGDDDPDDDPDGDPVDPDDDDGFLNDPEDD